MVAGACLEESLFTLICFGRNSKKQCRESRSLPMKSHVPYNQMNSCLWPRPMKPRNSENASNAKTHQKRRRTKLIHSNH